MSTPTDQAAQGLAALASQAQSQREQSAILMADRFQDTMDAIIAAYARARVQRMEIMNHNGAMLAYVSKAAAAKAMGLDEKQRLGVTPFPTPITITMDGATERERQLQHEVDALRAEAARPTSTAVTPVQASHAQSASIPTTQAPTASKSFWQKAWPIALTAALGVGGTAATMYATRPQPTTGSVDLEIEGWQQPRPVASKE